MFLFLLLTTSPLKGFNKQHQCTHWRKYHLKKSLWSSFKPKTLKHWKSFCKRKWSIWRAMYVFFLYLFFFSIICQYNRRYHIWEKPMYSGWWGLPRETNALLDLRHINYSCKIFLFLSLFQYHNALLDTQMWYVSIITPLLYFRTKHSWWCWWHGWWNSI